jgi:hypothetical protein
MRSGATRDETIQDRRRETPGCLCSVPLGLKGVVVGEGDTYEEALADVKSAIQFHIETFGPEVSEGNLPVLEAFIAEAGVAV